ncbi:hypothetical protein MTO96_051346, partial [Rhipicephalus appendiculatus]
MSVTTRAQMQRAAVTDEPGLAETDSENAQALEMHRSTLNASDQDAAMRLREKELDLEMLRMQIQLQTLRLQEQGIHESEGGRRAKLSSYAKDLRAVLPTMPESDDLAPAWFKSAETMLRSCDIPQDAAGAIIIPFLNEKSRTLVANKSEDRVLSYNEVRELVLSELKLTPEEYKRRFYGCRKGKESWGQCVTKLEINLDYYLRSRKVETVEELRALIVSDRAKEMMSHELCAYVLQHETGDWFSPMRVAELAENFEESRALHRQRGVVTDELAQDVDALLPPEVFEKLEREKKFAVEHAKKVAQLKDDTQRKAGNNGSSVLVAGSTEGAGQDKTEGLEKEESPLNSPKEVTAEPMRGQKEVEEEELGDVDNILDPSNDVAVYSDETPDELRDQVDMGRDSVRDVANTVNPSK